MTDLPQPPLQVAFNIDARYVQYCAVTMVSLLEHNKHRPVVFHIVAESLGEPQRRSLRELAGHYGATVCYYEPAAGALDGFSIRKFSGRVSMATYYRCLLSDLLPATVGRVLYLDCDILVLDRLDEFYDLPLDDVTPVAAVEDIAADERGRYTLLEYPAEDSYFNAGVLLINLEWWRRHAVGEACKSLYRANPSRFAFNDQDILNCLFHANRCLVPLRWNMQDGFYRPLPKFGMEWHAAHRAELLHPAILHFTNRKPWEYDNMHPLRRLYFDYLALTPWADRAARVHKPSWRLKRWIKLLPYSLRLRKKKYIELTE